MFKFIHRFFSPWCAIPLYAIMAILPNQVGTPSLIFLGTFTIIYALLITSAHKCKFIMKMLALIFKNSIAIELIDMHGNVLYSLAFRSKSRELKTFVYLFAQVGNINLNEDGTVNGRHYIEYWIPLSKKHRVEHILKYDIEDAITLKNKKAAHF